MPTVVLCDRFGELHIQGRLKYLLFQEKDNHGEFRHSRHLNSKALGRPPHLSDSTVIRFSRSDLSAINFPRDHQHNIILQEYCSFLDSHEL